jgi:hypothetical protein
MNIIEANEIAVKGKAIMNLDRKEWIVYSSGSYRWKNSRLACHFAPMDISSKRWISEDDLIIISKLQIEEAFNELSVDPQDTTAIKGFDEFIEHIFTEAKFNQVREEK